MAHTRERLVLLMMVLVAVAVGGIVRMHLAAGMTTAVLSGFIAWSSFMMLHLLVKRSSENSRMQLEILRLEHELSKSRPSSGSAGLQRAYPSPTAGEPKPQRGMSPPGAPAKSNEPAAMAAGPADGAQRAAQQMKPAASSADMPYVHAPISTDARWEQPHAPRTAAVPAAAPQTAGAAVPAATPINVESGQVKLQRSKGRDKELVARVRQHSHPSAEFGGEAPAPVPAPRSEVVDAPSWSGTAIATADPLRDAWSFRPREATETRAFAADSTSDSSGSLAPHAPSRPLEADLEMVQRKIKALADEVNSAEFLKQSAPVQAPSPAGPGGIDQSIAALRSTAGRMRAPASFPPEVAAPQPVPHHFPAGSPHQQAMNAGSEPSRQQAPAASLPSLEALIPATAEPIAVSQVSRRSKGEDADESPRARAPAKPAPAAETPAAKRPPYQQKIEDIAEAIDRGRMDVFLQPIVGLGDYAVAHFEVAVRLKTQSGAYIDRPEQVLNLGATDILALFDIERLNRTAKVAEQLEARGKTGSILSPTSAYAMTDAGFLEVFARKFEERNAISNQLVLTFTQADVAAFGPGTWQALEDMQSFGFRFALEHVTHLGTDFDDLAQRGFQFVKLPAEAFLAGMAAESGFVRAADICRHIASAGLTLVVEGVNDDQTLARVFGFGALFGQGQLFGGARQISLEALGPTTAAA